MFRATPMPVRPAQAGLRFLVMKTPAEVTLRSRRGLFYAAPSGGLGECSTSGQKDWCSGRVFQAEQGPVDFPIVSGIKRFEIMRKLPVVGRERVAADL